jgi:hypothetical protein
MKISKRMMTVDPTPKLKLQYIQIFASAEKHLMETTIQHYQTEIPRLHQEFDKYFKETSLLTPTDRRLLVLKLIHYKNQTIEERQPFQTEKLNRPDNRRLPDDDQATSEPQYREPRQTRNQSPDPRQNRDPRQYRNQDNRPNQQNDWGAPDTTNMWTQPRPQRQNQRGARGRGNFRGNRR